MSTEAAAGAISGRTRRIDPRRFAVPAIAAGSCLLAIAVFGVGARDDDYITYWVAEQFAKTGHLVNINGAHIEQSSSFAHVLLLAALYFVTRAPLPVLSYAVGLGSLAAVVVLSAQIAKKIRPGSELVTAAVVGLAFPITFWATGGLETTFAAALMAWFVLQLHAILATARPSVPSVCGFVASALLVVAVRPDTMIVASLLVLGCLTAAALRTRSVASFDRRLPALGMRSSLIATSGVLGSVVLLGAFRLLVFHSVLPQPELAKAGGIRWFSWGFSYVFTSFPWWMWAVLLTLAAIGTAWCIRTRSLLGLVTAATFVLGIGSLMFTRGDWMGGARLLVPYLAPGLVIMVVGAWSMHLWGRRVAIVSLLAVECVTLVLFAQGTMWLASSYTGNAPLGTEGITASLGSPFGATVTATEGHVPSLPWYTAWDFAHTRDAIFLANATPKLRQIVAAHAGKGPITIGSFQAGMVAYTWQNEFLRKLRIIDTDNVVTNDFSRCNGLFQSFAGQVITFPQWVADAGKCAPPLPDLLFTLDPPTYTPMLTRYYHVVSLVSISYTRSSLGITEPLLGTEFLAARNGWHP